MRDKEVGPKTLTGLYANFCLLDERSGNQQIK
jgi:hypothetical protein